MFLIISAAFYKNEKISLLSPIIYIKPNLFSLQERRVSATTVPETASDILTAKALATRMFPN